MNTIIAAPTGSGKTVVAVNIIKCHLEKNRNSGKKPKVLFMTPNTVILDQQADCLRKFLDHRYEVQAVCGSDNIPLREIIDAKDVIVSTPQLIVNLLVEDSINDGIENVIRSTFDVTTFTMMVFDECHSAVKNSPYAMLMRFYHRLSFSQRLPSKAALPQIIGLTASLGVGGKSTEKDALAHVVKLCAMLDCKVISTVRKNVGELRNFSPLVFDEICFCDGQHDSERIEFLETIRELMKIFEDKLHSIHSKYKAVAS
ncbi:DEAD/DEAH box helicase [Cooperia oncophora]